MDELSQLLVWLLFLALAIVAIQHGSPGLKNWWRSKFLGRTPGT